MAGGEQRHSFEWPKRRLPHQSAFRRWRATVFHVAEQTERHAAGFYHKHREGRIGNSPEQDKHSQQSGYEKTKRGYNRHHQGGSTAKKREREAPRTNNNARATGNRRDQKKTACRMGSIPQIPTGTYLKILPPMPQDASVQHGDHAHAHLRLWNMDTLERS